MPRSTAPKQSKDDITQDCAARTTSRSNRHTPVLDAMGGHAADVGKRRAMGRVAKKKILAKYGKCVYDNHG
jgi:hypothetical protein